MCYYFIKIYELWDSCNLSFLFIYDKLFIVEIIIYFIKYKGWGIIFGM